MEQLVDKSVHLQIKLKDAFTCAGVPDSTFYRARMGKDLRYDIGCTESLIHKWEQHKRVPSGFLFACWLDALGLTIKVHRKETLRSSR